MTTNPLVEEVRELTERIRELSDEMVALSSSRADLVIKAINEDPTLTVKAIAIECKISPQALQQSVSRHRRDPDA